MPATTHASDGRIVAENLSYSLPDGRTLFHNLSLAFGRERTGLIGPNGSGKTTLLRLLDGTLTPSAGSVRRSGVLGVLLQDFLPTAEQGLASVLGVEDRLAALGRLEAGRGDAYDLDLVADDWDLPARARAHLDRFGLQHLDLDRPVGSVSGGEATRVALAGLSLGRADVLLLDEPTNHLDAPSRRALYDFVEGWSEGLVCVSHDRALLGHMDRIVELSPLGVRTYGGNYDVYRAQRDAEDEAATRELDHARAALRTAEQRAREIAERQAHRDARGRRSRATANMPKILLNARKGQAQTTGARVRAVTEREVSERQARADAARARVEERERPRFQLASANLPANRTVLELRDVTVRYPGAEQATLRRVSLSLVGPQRVALVGPNGSGKSTILRVALGDLEPDEGTAVRLPDADVAFLDQHGSRLDPARSVLDNFRLYHPGMDRTEVRYALARFLFSDEAALQTAGTLSGGQRLRASLACVLGGERTPSLLLLDEPTNHLDLDALEALERALQAYDGALLVASHDRTFLDAIGATLLTVTTLSTLPSTT